VNSAYTADFWGTCYSNVPTTAFPGTKVCQRIIQDGVFTTKNVNFTFDGTLATGTEFVQTRTTGSILISSTNTLTAGELATLTGIVYANMATLVRKQGDIPNAAPGLGIGGGAGSMFGLAVIWAIATLAGAALLVPF
jgi:hypothetical protein